MKKGLSILFILTATTVAAQHDHHPQPAPKPKPQVQPVKKDTVPATKKPMDDHHHHQHTDSTMKPAAEPSHENHTEMRMPTHAYSLNLPMNRNASGTAWNPDSSAMYMWMKQGKKTDWMFHGTLFARYTHTDVFNNGSRGDGKMSFPNWFMAMMNHRTGKKGLLNATAMISLDRITEGGSGYPLLFQSGETWRGKRLIDRQHPHDLFSALSIGYSYSLSKDADLFGYFGYPGEPALGAPAFMHRVSSMNNPDAPLGHHWQDATHITFGVGTIGFRYKNFKAEGSIFTGREPDENRYDFDKARFDSYSYRISYNPTGNWALQFSQGFIESPEALEPAEDVKRTTASILFAKKMTKNHLSAAAIWGQNDKGADHKEHSFLLEGNYQQGMNAFYSRYEYIQKSKEELDLDETFPHKNFNIHSFTGGYNRQLASFNKIDLVAGGQFTLHAVYKSLQALYGRTPVGFQVYFQFRPTLHHH